LIGAAERGDLSDGQFLDRFADCRDETAFAALVERHGSLLLNVCRRVLNHKQDAEDAFQAVFLVLARRAAALDRRRSLGSWLYTVAYHVGLDIFFTASVGEELLPGTQRRLQLDGLFQERSHRHPRASRCPLRAPVRHAEASTVKWVLRSIRPTQVHRVASLPGRVPIQMLLGAASTPRLNMCASHVAVLLSNVCRQFHCELRRRNLPEPADVLARPQGREPRFRGSPPGAQRGDNPSRPEGGDLFERAFENFLARPDTMLRGRSEGRRSVDQASGAFARKG